MTTSRNRSSRRTAKPERPSDVLPRKFTRAERDAYDWLHYQGIRPWLVDLATKRVTTPSGKAASLVESAKIKGMKP